MPHTISAIIPTYNRPDSLDDCLQSILKQTRLPDELIIVDDGDLGGFPLKDQFESAGVKCVYEQKNIPGVTESRNRAAEIATFEVLVFLEDDVVLFDDYIEQLVNTFDTCNDDTVVGVGGIIENDWFRYPKDLFEYLPFLLFGLTGLREGKVKRSGFATDYGKTPWPIKKTRSVDFLLGGVSAFKRSVFSEFQFSNRYRSASGYGQGEDKEFSYRVSRKYRLLVNPSARLYHYCAPKSNFNWVIKGRAFVLSRYYFFRDQVRRTPFDWLFFWFALFGYSLYRIGIALVSFKKKEWRRVQGIATGLLDICRGRSLDSL
ncbi:glycosyltransferase [Gilvimarinus sp. SDUM040013]|uniref:Glycosyltransferase n=1 Tax=Gilvimarinus gilvus TaxID=3058038 RepID=A0ABU4RTN0_9GAMM|nr:glycosyltransferase [Gilvimarinus sp. SDUM040013]MDO3386845.1 glycosyltransferase [Gilvimarinus sp. SDUM040013]MDX6848225.1 glycosyltransferase [Gilvimarinus sp. SDUM040013]